jgi:hypothetical protein
MLDKYEASEQKYNSAGKYRELERPGQAFLTLVKAMNDLFQNACSGSPVYAE